MPLNLKERFYMLNSKEIINDIMQLFVESPKKPYVIGNGILTSTKIGFDEGKLNEKKGEIATILQELGIDEHSMISLLRLTVLKSDEVWNKLQSLEDFQALELLLACSDACGFVQNDPATIQRNIAEIGDINSILISNMGRSLVGNDDEWLRLIREIIIKKMYFLTNPDSIKSFAANSQELTETPVHNHK